MVATAQNSRWRAVRDSLLAWFDASAVDLEGQKHAKRIDWLRTLPFIGMHVACLAVIWVGWSPIALAMAVFFYLLRMFAITGFYHRYFSHRSFKTSRTVQFVFALVGASSAQRGPAWWAAHHRHHHATAEREDDPHSPVHHGLWWSHTGWFLSRQHFPVQKARVRDWQTYPELRFLDRYDIVIPAVLALGMYLLGAGLEAWAPQLGTSGGQMLVWGFFISTVVLYHGTFTINSLAHRWGTRRYDTPDNSRNNFLLALLTLGEGWHNNHHHYPVSVRQGFYWWEIDITYYLLRGMSAIGLIWDLKPVPVKRRESGRLNDERRKTLK